MLLRPPRPPAVASRAPGSTSRERFGTERPRREQGRLRRPVGIPGPGVDLAPPGVEHRQHRIGLVAVRPGGAAGPAPGGLRPRPAGCRSAWPSALAVATPIRRPVNVPGPSPTAIRSIASQPRPASSMTWAISGRSRVAWAGRARRRRVVTAFPDAPRPDRQGHRGGPRRGVEGQDPHRDLDLHVRSSGPACSIRTRAATDARARPARPPGRATRRTRSCPGRR